MIIKNFAFILLPFCPFLSFSHRTKPDTGKVLHVTKEDIVEEPRPTAIVKRLCILSTFFCVLQEMGTIKDHIMGIFQSAVSMKFVI
jgi:hypothetical protein